MTAIIPTRGLGTFNAGDRRERYQGPGDVAAKGDGEDEAITIAAAAVALELGADVNAANGEGDTALHIAAALALDDVVRFLVQRGAALDARNKRGQTPLGITTGAPSRSLLPAFFMNPELRKETAALLRELGAKE
jgi:ankyrin repeat protein